MGTTSNPSKKNNTLPTKTRAKGVGTYNEVT